ncbi:hypothetical protein DLAC_08833 [Tieghemostelium lacteum]|uniref:F-box domain-containing protein n=1 Tax=Tieghemostelium lacteum TaxID=361077 RepID=A0A151Z8F6_TIELA|nr:hypothetical protein DLAC_08833 [Tieghemostelium lacteum]|eukprot:KYQ90232.1 hypothetical protein DLAC_08833 [Tieghemostelium lacteum]
MTNLPLPNYIILKILNNLASQFKQLPVILEFLRIASLVCKDWKEKLIPKIDFYTLSIDMNYKYKTYKEFKDILKFNINGFTVNFQENDQSVYDLIFNDKHKTSIAKSFIVKTLDIKNSFDKLKLLDEYFGGITGIEGINSGGKKLSLKQLSDLPLRRTLTHLDLSSILIDPDDLISFVDSQPLDHLTLKSTPYGYEGLSDSVDKLYIYMKSNKTITSFNIFNYFYAGSKSLVIDLLNSNSNITEMCVTNLTKTFPEDIENDPHEKERRQLLNKIQNNTLKKLYVDSNLDWFHKWWDFTSAIKELTLSPFGTEELSLVTNSHGLLKTLTVGQISDPNLVCELIKKNTSITHLIIYQSNWDVNQVFLEALNSNTVIQSIKLLSITADRFKALLNLNHSSLFELIVKLESAKDFLDSKKEICNCNYIKSLKIELNSEHFNDETYSSLFEVVLNIIKSNLNLISFECATFNRLDKNQLNSLISVLKNRIIGLKKLNLGIPSLFYSLKQILIEI